MEDEAMNYNLYIYRNKYDGKWQGSELWELQKSGNASYQFHLVFNKFNSQYQTLVNLREMILVSGSRLYLMKYWLLQAMVSTGRCLDVGAILATK